MTNAPFRLLALALLAPLLTGCLTSSSQPQQTTDERCAARGHPADSQAYRECVAQIDGVRERRMEQRRRDMMESSNIPAAATRN